MVISARLDEEMPSGLEEHRSRCVHGWLTSKLQTEEGRPAPDVNGTQNGNKKGKKEAIHSAAFKGLWSPLSPFNFCPWFLLAFSVDSSLFPCRPYGFASLTSDFAVSSRPLTLDGCLWLPSAQTAHFVLSVTPQAAIVSLLCKPL